MGKAVLFDLDGTLADTLESLAYCTNRALVDFSFQPLDKMLFKKFVGNGSRMQITRALRAVQAEEMLRRDGETDDDGFRTQPRLLEEVHERYLAYFAKDCMYGVRPYEGIVPLLEQLKQQGIKIAVFSNKPHANTVEVTETLFGKGYFDSVRGQKDGYPKKPAPDGVHAILNGLGVSAADCLYVGDSWVDMETGHNAGARAVGVLWGFRDRAELEAHHADAVISRPEELLELV